MTTDWADDPNVGMDEVQRKLESFEPAHVVAHVDLDEIPLCGVWLIGTTGAQVERMVTCDRAAGHNGTHGDTLTGITWGYQTGGVISAKHAPIISERNRTCFFPVPQTLQQGAKVITIYGASDDLVEVDGCIGADEFNVYNSNHLLRWQADFIAPDGQGMRVYAIYDSCWHFSVGQIDEDKPIPDWQISISQRHDVRYSAQLAMNAPDGTRLVVAHEDEDDES